MNMKRFVIFALTLCLLFGLCACGDTVADNKETTGETAESTQETTEATDDGKVTYTVTVVDEGGNPVANAGVQLCKDTCLPGMTNADGVAEFNVLEDDYKVSFMAMPEGYAADAEEFYFEDGSYELTITLKAVA
ncbi:MAG: hypothetical protein IJX37_01295 [Oscillospiraceae bacterium]|nr:hypothetical protein [Oscillospiraceae bacterium]